MRKVEENVIEIKTNVEAKKKNNCIWKQLYNEEKDKKGRLRRGTYKRQRRPAKLKRAKKDQKERKGRQKESEKRGEMERKKD